MLNSGLLGLALHFAASRRVTQLGLLAGLIGGVVVAFSGVSRGRRRGGLLLGGLLIALGFGLVIIAVHFGASPYRRHK